jgi:hypothetical protein
MIRNALMALRVGLWAVRHWRQLSFIHYDSLRHKVYPETVRRYLYSAPFAAANIKCFAKDNHQE